MAKKYDTQFLVAAQQSDAWSVAARADLDATMVASWDKALLRKPRLLVPIDVQALYVPQGHGETYAEIPLALTRADGEMPTPPDPFAETTARAAGVHLHWAQPDALLNGEMRDSASDRLSLKPLPNRWVVLRILAPNRATRTVVRGWIVESDTARIFDLDRWHEGASGGTKLGRTLAPEELTGVAGGALSWTAGYDPCQGRFALHDPLDDLDTVIPQGAHGNLASYLVAGWWSDPRHDPLDAARSATGLQNVLSAMKWSVNYIPADARSSSLTASRMAKLRKEFGLQEASRVEVVDTKSMTMATEQLAERGGTELFLPDGVRFVAVEPRHHYTTLLHGAVHGVPVGGPVVADNRPSSDRTQLAVGTQIEDVLSSLATTGLGLSQTQERRQAERLLTAFANDRMTRIGEPNGAAELEEFEHAGGFQSLPGGDGSDERIIDRGGPEALPAGRHARAAAAGRPATSGKGDKDKQELIADIVWTGRKRGVLYAEDPAKASLGDRLFEKGSAKPAAGSRLVRRAGPRYHLPIDPILAVRNAKRSLRHRVDGRAGSDGTLGCRWPSEIATSLGDRVSGKALLGSFATGAIPSEVLRLARSAVAFDPYIGRWLADAASADTGTPAPELLARIKAEIALRYSRDGGYDGSVPAFRASKTGRLSPDDTRVADQLRRFSLAEGVDPDPVAVTSWAQPWSPIWLEWEVTLSVTDQLEGWSLGGVDLETDAARPGDTERTITGRSALNTGAAQMLVDAFRSWIDLEEQRDADGQGEASEATEDDLADIIGQLRCADVLSASLDGILDDLLGLPPAAGGQVHSREGDTLTGPAPVDLPMLVYSGRMRLKRARIIDAFGRVLDLDAGQAVYPAREALAQPDGMRLRPRLARPARWLFRFADPGDSAELPREANIDEAQPSLMVNPISGYLLPDLIDEALEVFDADGTPLGQIMHEPLGSGIQWEIAPGRDGPVDAGPLYGLADAQLPLGRLAAAMVATDARVRGGLAGGIGGDSSLTAFLRAVDTTLWSIDTFASLGTPHVAGLVGRPMAVVRATLRLDIKDDLDSLDLSAPGARTAREEVYATLADRAFPLRLGELARDDDGLYGYFVNDDFTRFHLVDKLVAKQALASGHRRGHFGRLGKVAQVPETSPIEHPYIVAEDRLTLHPGQILRLTLLMHPAGKVHLTSGVLPRKALQLARNWTSKGLSRIAPSARIGPVLIDSGTVRLPRVASFGKDQVWTRRDTPTTWRDDPILAATQSALMPDTPAQVEEGYIRILPETGKAQTS